jgi:hypothetical protein
MNRSIWIVLSVVLAIAVVIDAKSGDMARLTTSAALLGMALLSAWRSAQRPAWYAPTMGLLVLVVLASFGWRMLR